MSLNESQTIYCIGIGGIGVSGLAQLLAAEGKQVSGSDAAESGVTKRVEAAGIPVSVNQDGSTFREECDLVIYSGAVPEDHPERALAAERGITQLSYFEALGEYSSQFEHVVAVSGTHGKSSTTAMIANVLVAGGLNPTVIVGSVVREFGQGDGSTEHGSNARVGGKEIFVVEACEYQSQFLHLNPSLAVVNNIEADHLDYYEGIDQIQDAFQQFVDKVPASGTVVVNADDPQAMMLQMGERAVVTTGWEDHATVQATRHALKEQAQQFMVGDSQFVLDVPGTFNVSNALMAIAVARHFEVDDSVTAEILAAYNGIWRRFEILGTFRKALLVSDYAHHPSEISATIQAARDFYPKSRIVVAFQPHQRARTASLFDDFVSALSTADLLILQEIYDVAGREEQHQDMNSHKLIEAIEKVAQGELFPIYTPDGEATADAIEDIVEKDDVIIIMGAGDIYKVAEEFAA